MDYAEEKKKTIELMRTMFLEGQRPTQIIDYLIDQKLVGAGNIIGCIHLFRCAFFISIRSANAIGASRRFENNWSDADIDQELSAAIQEKRQEWTQAVE